MYRYRNYLISASSRGWVVYTLSGRELGVFPTSEEAESFIDEYTVCIISAHWT